MSTDNMTIAYMVKGATSNLNRLTRAVAVSSEGELEYLQEVVDLADTVEEQFKAYYSDGNYSGVFVYDVAEPIGQWITYQTVLNDHIPSKESVTKKAAELISQHID